MPNMCANVHEDGRIREILRNYATVAVVGLSRDPKKDSYRVARYLQAHDYTIIPINPVKSKILDQESYPSLMELPESIQKTIEIVEIFRPITEVSRIVDQVILLRKNHGTPSVIWMQLGIVHEEAANRARETGMLVVMDKCMMREHSRLVSTNL